jgi:hypothetical protein
VFWRNCTRLTAASIITDKLMLFRLIAVAGAASLFWIGQPTRTLAGWPLKASANAGAVTSGNQQARLINFRQTKPNRKTARPAHQRMRATADFAAPAGPTLFVASAPATPLSTTPAARGKQVLSAADFQFLGAPRVPDGVGWCMGLAYRPSTRTFFSIGKAGRPPYRLVEYALPEPVVGGEAPRASLVKDWGPLDENQLLSPPRGMWRMEGLFWEEERQRLWLSWGNYYNAKHTNDPCLAYATLEPLALHGPWRVPAGVHSETCRGQIKPAPSALAAVTHAPWTMFGGRGNTDQLQTWGTGLVAVGDPDNAPVGAEISAARLVHWPMLSQKFADPRQPSKQLIHYYSAFPRMNGDICRRIYGNNNVKLPNRPSYEYNVFVDDNSHLLPGDGIFHSAWIETRSRECLFYYGRVSVGYSWYGNPESHCDKSAKGQRWQNNLESLLFPGQPCIDKQGDRGNHADQRPNRAYFVNPQDVLAAAQLAMAGRLTPVAAQVPPASIAEFENLGGDVPAARTLSDCYWNAGERRLYLLAPGLGGGGGAVLVWSVRD